MKKEGTGEPRASDIEFDAAVKMRELRFEEVPDPDVRFRGSTGRNSVWGSRRENLPDEVQEGVVYRNARVRLRIATEVADGGPGRPNGSKREREKTSPEHRERKTVEREPEKQEEGQ